MHRSILEAVRVLPGVEAAAEAAIVPMSGSGWNNRIVIDGKAQADYSNFNQVSPGYFDVTRTRVLSGRDFGEA
jgi:hypothetical protein